MTLSPYKHSSAQVEVSYLVHLFGRVRNEVEGLMAEVDRLLFERDAVALTLSGNLANAVFQDVALRADACAPIALIRAQAAHFADTTALFVALGVGFGEEAGCVDPVSWR